MEIYTIEELLSNPKKCLEFGWFYLPPNENNWTLKTEGMFCKFDEDLEPDPYADFPKEVSDRGWIPTVEGSEIDDIVFYATEQKKNLTIDDLFNSFVYYFVNDAFLDF